MGLIPSGAYDPKNITPDRKLENIWPIPPRIIPKLIFLRKNPANPQAAKANI